jgi:hypothetical protein
MQLKNVASFLTLGAFVVSLSVGCNQGTDIPLARVPPATPSPTKPAPKEVKKGGGPGSSGHMQVNPGAED